MVQRQRADPGGANGNMRLGAAQEPDASVTLVKSEDGAYPTHDVVVDAIDTRHVVDELRDTSSNERDRQKESSILSDLIDLTKRLEMSETPMPRVEVSRASWFDVFDWKNLNLTTEPSIKETSTSLLEVAQKEEVVSLVTNEENQVEATPQLTNDDEARHRAVSPKPDHRTTGRRVRDVLKSKTVVSSRDVLASRDVSRILRSGQNEFTPVVQSKDLVTVHVERFNRPSSTALSKIFQREASAPRPKLLSEEFTSASVVSASEIRGASSPRASKPPALLSEEFTADSIVSTSELESMYFVPSAPVDSPKISSTNRKAVLSEASAAMKETSLMDDVYSTFSEKAADPIIDQDTKTTPNEILHVDDLEPALVDLTEGARDATDAEMNHSSLNNQPNSSSVVQSENAIGGPENAESAIKPVRGFDILTCLEIKDDTTDACGTNSCDDAKEVQKEDSEEQFRRYLCLNEPTKQAEEANISNEKPRSYFCFNADEKSLESENESADTVAETNTSTLLPQSMLNSFLACIDPSPSLDDETELKLITEGINTSDVKGDTESTQGLAIKTALDDVAEKECEVSDPSASITPNDGLGVNISPVASSENDLSPASDFSLSPIAALSPIASMFQNILSSSVLTTTLQTQNPLPTEEQPTDAPKALNFYATEQDNLQPTHTLPNKIAENVPSSPAVIEICEEDKDEESTGGNLLDNDLDSVPSVTEDVEESGAPMKAEDLGPSSRPNITSAELVENKVKKLRLLAEQLAANFDDGSTVSQPFRNRTKPKMDPSVDARRRLLVKELRSSIAKHGRYDIRCANISAALGDLLEEAQDYDHALKLHKDTVTIYSCKLGDDHTTTMDAKVRLGAVLENAGELEEAISNYYQVTVMRRALRGDQDSSVGDGLVCMANALRKKGDYDQAIKELKRALKVFRESLGDSHAKVAATVDEIASLYVTIGNFDKSAAILEEVVKLKAATTGVKSKAVAATLSQLATAYECSDKFAEAMKALKKSYKIFTEIGGYSSEDATTTLSRMAQLYEATNDHNRAAVAYLGVLRGRKIQRGADHLSVGETYFRLGRSLRETKQFDKALKCHKEALPIFVGQGVEMNDVKMVAEIMHEMALISQDRGHFEDATRIFKQELSVRRKIGQPEFPFATRALKHLGVNEYNLKNYSRSLKYLVEALTIYKEHGDQGVDCGEILYHTGLVFQRVNNNERALEAFVEAVRIFADHNVDKNNVFLRGSNDNIKLIEGSMKKTRRFPM